MRSIVRLAAVGWAAVATCASLPAQCVEADLLVAGGSEAAGTLAAQAVAEGREPRAVVTNPASVRAVRHALVRGAAGHPGVAIVAWQDLTPDDPRFEAANLAPLPPDAASFFYCDRK